MLEGGRMVWAGCAVGKWGMGAWEQELGLLVCELWFVSC